jgi:homoserine/homoserine lactone efflux protein
MNYHLFSAFLLITFILVIVPGPIVTLVITTGATRGIRAALMTVLGSTVGNAVLITCIALGLNWILRTSAEVFEILRWAGAAYLVGWVSRRGCMPGNRRRSRRHVITSTFPVASWWP